MSVHYFVYDGMSSEDLYVNPYEKMELTFGYFNASEVPLNMERTQLAGSINRHRLRNRAMGAQWSNVLVFDISLIKSPCYHANEDLIFTEDEVDYINKWLTSPEYPTLLHIYEADYDFYLDDPITYSNLLYLKYDYHGIFTNVTPMYVSGQIVGLTATFTTNSPFAWTQEITRTFECRGTTEINIDVNSSEKYGDIYPLIEVKGINIDAQSSSRENITITNERDLAVETYYDQSNGYETTSTPRSLTLEVPHTSIYIDCDKARIYDIISIQAQGYNRILDWDDLGLTDVSYIYWPRLFNGENTWTVTGDCDLTITYREPRKVGAY